uniref:Uncharacterized protein n=1 Tax=Romanomermis culicivorax TaxID=13658 RepID=A0A915LBD7_ROMCU
RKNCNKSEIQECIDDCELKKWSHWSKCTLNANDNLHYRKRERMENNQSLGHFSNKSCRKWDTEACPTTTAPITLMVHIIDESTPPPIELGNIYILVVVGCMAAAISDLGAKYRWKNKAIPDRFLLKKKNRKLHGGGPSPVDISQTRKVKRKSADDVVKLKPKLRKK